jgi:hypothetical protein
LDAPWNIQQQQQQRSTQCCGIGHLGQWICSNGQIGHHGPSSEALPSKAKGSRGERLATGVWKIGRDASKHSEYRLISCLCRLFVSSGREAPTNININININNTQEDRGRLVGPQELLLCLEKEIHAAALFQQFLLVFIIYVILLLRSE